MPRVATRLAPTKSGGFVARKRVPKDVQSEYARLYGVRLGSALQRASRYAPSRLARAKHREWLHEIESRIANIRARRNGGGQSLTPKDARALAGEWYGWFVERQRVQVSARQNTGSS